MAIAIRISATQDQLLNQWQSQGWSITRGAVLNQIPYAMSTNKPMVQIQLDAFEWVDITAFGIGNTDSAVSKIRDLIRQGGSDLYAYTLFQKTDLNVLGIKVQRYRLLFCHSLVQLVVAAVAILAIAFAAVIFYQYVTTGAFPSPRDLSNMWAGIVKPVQDAVTQPIGAAAGAISNTYIWATAAAAAIAIAFGVASKSAGVNVRQPKPPGGSIGVRSGPVSARVSS